MAIQIVQTSVGNTAGATSVTTTFPNPVATGNGVVLITGSGNFNVVTGSDTAGNTYTEAAGVGGTGGTTSEISFTPASVGGFRVLTASYAGSSTIWAVAVEILGTIAVDVHNVNTANSTSQPCGAITTTGNDRAPFVVDHAGSSISSQPAGFTTDYNPSPAFWASHQVVTAIQTAFNPTFLASGSTTFAAGVVAFSSTNVGSPPPQYYLPQVRRTTFLAGPWPFGLPYVPQIRISPAPPAPPVPVPSVPTGAPSTLPLFLRIGLFHSLPVPPGRTGSVPPPTPPPPPGPGHGKNKSLFRRLTNIDDPRRIREIHDKLSSCLNSLMLKGQLRWRASDDYEIVATAHTDTRDPNANDDVLQGFGNGAQWVNTVTHKLFFLVNNSQGAAVWIGPIG